MYKCGLLMNPYRCRRRLMHSDTTRCGRKQRCFHFSTNTHSWAPNIHAHLPSPIATGPNRLMRVPTACFTGHARMQAHTMQAHARECQFPPFLKYTSLVCCTFMSSMHMSRLQPARHHTSRATLPAHHPCIVQTLCTSPATKNTRPHLPSKQAGHLEHVQNL